MSGLAPLWRYFYSKVRDTSNWLSSFFSDDQINERSKEETDLIKSNASHLWDHEELAFAKLVSPSRKSANRRNS